MSTERFDPDRLVLSMRYSTEVYRAELEETLAGLPKSDVEEAEHVVATAGEDEASYGPRDPGAFLDELCRLADEFLADDEMGCREMLVHVTRHVRCPATLEFWFQVGSPGGIRAVRIRQMVVALDDGRVYAALGAS